VCREDGVGEYLPTPRQRRSFALFLPRPSHRAAARFAKGTFLEALVAPGPSNERRPWRFAVASGWELGGPYTLALAAVGITVLIGVAAMSQQHERTFSASVFYVSDNKQRADKRDRQTGPSPALSSRIPHRSPATRPRRAGSGRCDRAQPETTALAPDEPRAPGVKAQTPACARAIAQSRSPALADIIGAPRVWKVAMTSSASMPCGV
jgi:hypothetical protein